MLCYLPFGCVQSITIKNQKTEREEWICQVREADVTAVAATVVAPAEVIGEGRVALWVADPVDIMEGRVADPVVWGIVLPWAVCHPWGTDPHHPHHLHHPVADDTAMAMATAEVAAAW